MTPRWRIADNLAQVDSGHRVLVLVLDDPEQPNPHAFTGSGAEIWRAIDGASPEGVELEQVVLGLAEAFELAPSDIRADVEQFAQTLAGMGLIVTLEHAGDPAGGAE